MDILKNPIITKVARALVCLFALLTMIGSFVALFSSVSLKSAGDMNKGYSLLNSTTGGAAMARAMAIVTFILSIGTVVLAYFSKHNLIISACGAGAALVQFVMGLVLSPMCDIFSISMVAMQTGESFPGGYVAVMIILAVMSIAVGICNVLGILKSDVNIPVFQGVQQLIKPNNGMMGQQPNMMGQPQQMQQMQQPYQQPVPQPTQAQQPYPQPVPQPTQAQQPYPQPVPQPTQAQQPYPQSVPQPTQAQQPYQQGVPQPTQPQQYQQPNNFNHQ